MLKRILPLGVIALLVFSVVVLNKGIDRNAPDSGDKDLAAAAGLLETPKPKDLPAASSVADPLPLEITFGNPATAKHKLTVGWSYDDYAMTQDGITLAPLIQAANAWMGSHAQDGSIQFVNVDAPKSELSPAGASVTAPGVFMNGKPTIVVRGNPVTLTGNPGENYTIKQFSDVIFAIPIK